MPDGKISVVDEVAATDDPGGLFSGAGPIAGTAVAAIGHRLKTCRIPLARRMYVSDRQVVLRFLKAWWGSKALEHRVEACWGSSFFGPE